MTKEAILAFCQKLTPPLWCLFFITLFVPIQIQMGENESFWNGNFDPFQTLFWPISFCVLAAALLSTSVQFFSQKKKEREEIPSEFALLWCGFLFWGSIVMWKHGVNPISLSFLLLWILLGMMNLVISKRIVLLRQIVLVFGWMALFQTFLALFQTIPGFLSSVDFAVGEPVLRSDYGEILRASGTLLHPNILGFFLVFTFFLIEGLGENWKKWRYIFVLGIICTFSRSALLALLAGSVTMFFVNFDKKKVLSSEIVHLCSIATFSIGGLLLRHVFDTASPSNFERISQIGIAIELIKDNFLWGVGIGNFTSYMATFDTFFPWQLQPVHNLFLLIGSEMGFIALMLLFLMFLRTAKEVFHLKKSVHKNVVIGIFMTICVFGIFEHLLLTSIIGIVLLGVFVGLISQNDH